MKIKIRATDKVREHKKYGPLVNAMQALDWKPNLTDLKRILGVSVSTLHGRWERFERDHDLELRLKVKNRRNEDE